MSQEDAQKYTHQKLKIKLQTKADFIVFHSAPQANKPDLINHVSLKIRDIINKPVHQKKKLNEILTAQSMSCDLSRVELSEMGILFYASLIIRSLRKSNTIFLGPLNRLDISPEKSLSLLNQELYTFINWIFSTTPPQSMDIVDPNLVKNESETLHRYTMSLGQDIIFMASRGKCKPPKHIGLSQAFHQKTQSKDLVTLVNRFGHGVSYEEVQRIDTCWSEIQLSGDGFIIPQNMAYGQVTTGAGDNFNRAIESVKGEHHDVVNMVLLQPETTSLQRNGDFGNVQQRRSSTARTLSQANVTPIDLQCPNLAGKQLGRKHFLGKINIDWFKTCTPEHQQLKEINQAFRLLRMMPLKLFEAEIEKRPSQTVPGWTVYHATITTKQTSIKTAIGYCLMIPAPATDFNTVYSMMKYFQRLFSALGQQ